MTEYTNRVSSAQSRGIERIVHATALVAGLVVVVVLFWNAGPRVILRMLGEVGWAFFLVAALYIGQQIARGVAMWRSLATPVRLPDVIAARIGGDVVEALTSTGPFLAEPARWKMLKDRGLSGTAALSGLVTEYFLYTLVASWMAAFALTLLLSRGLLAPALRGPVIGLIAAVLATTAATALVLATGVRWFDVLCRALPERARLAVAARTASVEEQLVLFFRRNPGRLRDVVVLEAAAHLMLASEIAVVLFRLGFFKSALDPVIVEGGAKFISVAFFFVPGEVGAADGVYALLMRTIGAPTAAALTLVAVRRIRRLVVAAGELVVMTRGSAFKW